MEPTESRNAPLHRVQIGTIAVAVVLLTFIAGWNLRPLLEDGRMVGDTAVQEESAIAVTIDNGSGALEELPMVPYLEGDSVLTIMQTLEEAGLIVLSMAETDPSLAAVDVAISSLADTPEAPGWHFWVNDTYGTMAPEAYPVQPGDHIHFTFTQSGD